jgi:hypothetical protein
MGFCSDFVALQGGEQSNVRYDNALLGLVVGYESLVVVTFFSPKRK